jgi:hypothetical protein
MTATWRRRRSLPRTWPTGSTQRHQLLTAYGLAERRHAIHEGRHVGLEPPGHRAARDRAGRIGTRRRRVRCQGRRPNCRPNRPAHESGVRRWGHGSARLLQQGPADDREESEHCGRVQKGTFSTSGSRISSPRTRSCPCCRTPSAGSTARTGSAPTSARARTSPPVPSDHDRRVGRSRLQMRAGHGSGSGVIWQ